LNGGGDYVLDGIVAVEKHVVLFCLAFRDLNRQSVPTPVEARQLIVLTRRA
jgi:hypothetical protein